MIKAAACSLRAIEERDLHQLLEWRNNPKHRQFFREHRELNYVQQMHWFNEKVNYDTSTKMFAIVDIEDNLIGACGLCYIDWVNRSADLSIYLGNRYIDEVIAPEAAKLLINYAFDTLGLNRIWSEIYDYDRLKCTFFENLNFHLDGKFRQSKWLYGEWHDSLIYSFLRYDYESYSAEV